MKKLNRRANWASFDASWRGLLVVDLRKRLDWLKESQAITGLSAVSKTHIRKHLAHVLEGHEKSYANNQFRALQQFFTFLESEEDIKNPMTGMKPPTVPGKLVPVISDSEYDKLISACEGKNFFAIRDRAIFSFFKFTGARRAEVASRHRVRLRQTVDLAASHASSEHLRHRNECCRYAAH